jgi:pro-kumamolisin-like protein/Big-like domain-containing protein
VLDPNLLSGGIMRSPLRHFIFCASIFFSVLVSILALGATARAQDTPKSSSSEAAIIPARITQTVDDNNLVVLKGNVHPLARPEFDQGPVADSQPLKRMLLLLQRSPEQETALQQLLEDQQNKSSANYHAWLTPAQFGKQFGPADADIQTVTQWLTSQGFTDIKVGHGRNVIEFSGNVAAVRNAFHTEIHRFLVNGEEHQANASDPQMPVALTPVVVGIVSLHNFRPVSHVLRVGSFHRSKSGAVTPLYTLSSQFFALAPADFGIIYNVESLWTAGITGTGQSIAVLGESNIKVQDVIDFRTIFNLPQNFSSQNVILNGVDPGLNGSEIESDLDIQWAGATAPGATIDFVTSSPTETTSGIHLSAVYAVNNNLAGVISVSFGACEQNLGSTGNQFFQSLWQQAAAQGITVAVSSGDGGSAGCDNFDTQQTATQGLAVSGFASTPYNIAVGGTDFDQNNNWSKYWSLTNDPVTHASALSYIPEIPWNDSCAQISISGCGSSAPGGSLNIVAGSGGPSAIYSKPSWQSGTGVPSDGKRDLPDVSLFASNGFTGSLYLICNTDQFQSFTGKCDLTSFGATIQGVGGTSASAPAFAGIMALVNQKQASRQGNANYVLYALAKRLGASCPSSAATSTCIFNDVTTGNSDLPTGLPGIGTNSVPCTGGTPNCNVTTASSNGVLVSPSSSTTEAWTVSPGYDMATGLGSVNAQNLVNNWSSVTSLPSATTLSATVNGKAVASISGIAHGTPITVSSSVSPGSSGTGTPSGQVALIASPNPTPGNLSTSLGIETLPLANGNATSSSVILPGGTYNLTAHYQGDGTFGPSDSTPAIPVNITTESSKTLISIPVFDPTTGKETGNTPTSVAYGSPYIARIDVGNSSASLTFPPQAVCSPPDCPTGAITLTDSLNGGSPAPLDAGTFPLNSSGFTEDFVIQLLGGSHVLSASYNGDSSFNASSNTYTLTVTPGATRILPPNPPMPPVVATPFNLGVILTMNFFGVMPSCNFTFNDGTTALPGTATCAWQANGPFLYVSLSVSQTTVGTHTYAAKFNGDANYAPSTSAPMTTNVFYGTTTTLSANSTNVQYGTSITLTAVVDSTVSQGPPIGQSVAFTFNNTPLTGTVTYTPFTDSSGNIALRASLTAQPQYSGFYSANFAGDSTYYQSGSLINVTVNIPDFSLSATQSSVTTIAGQPATTTITVTPTSNAASPVTLSCPQGYLPVNVTCSFSPPTVNLSNGNAGTSILTLNSLPPSPTNTISSAPLNLLPPSPYFPTYPVWPPALLAAVASLLLFASSRSRRRERFASVAALGVAFALFAFFLGCGGGSTGTGGGGGGGGPVPSSITLTADNVKVAYPTNINLTARVTSSKAPGGTVTFLIDGPGGVSNIPLVNGVAQYQIPVPQLGTHVIRAQYSGDANTQSSQTAGSLNVVVTGNGVGVIFGTTGNLAHSTNIQFTLQ